MPSIPTAPAALHLLTLPPAAQAPPPGLLEPLERIMWAQVTMAVVMVVCGLVLVGAAVALLLLARKAARSAEQIRGEGLLTRADAVLDALEARVRRLGQVLDALQEQAESRLGDPASAPARQEPAARALREDEEGRSRGRRADTDSRRG